MIPVLDLAHSNSMLFPSNPGIRDHQNGICGLGLSPFACSHNKSPEPGAKKQLHEVCLCQGGLQSESRSFSCSFSCPGHLNINISREAVFYKQTQKVVI